MEGIFRESERERERERGREKERGRQRARERGSNGIPHSFTARAAQQPHPARPTQQPLLEMEPQQRQHDEASDGERRPAGFPSQPSSALQLGLTNAGAGNANSAYQLLFDKRVKNVHARFPGLKGILLQEAIFAAFRVRTIDQPLMEDTQLWSPCPLLPSRVPLGLSVSGLGTKARFFLTHRVCLCSLDRLVSSSAPRSLGPSRSTFSTGSRTSASCATPST